MFTELTSQQLQEKKDYINSYIGALNAASGSSMDPNANITSKNVATLTPDLFKDFQVQLKRKIVSDYISKLYGEDLAEEYNRQISAHEIYVHDESHTCLPYCTSISMYPFLLEGLGGLGGDAKAPKHLDSFCGGFINLVYCLSSQFAGACNPYHQPLFVKQNGLNYKKSFGAFVESFDLNKSFENYQGVWEYADLRGLGYQTFDREQLVDITKVYRRKYSGDILRIKTHKGYSVDVSEDHKFKILFRGREFDASARDLVVGDTVFMDKDTSMHFDKQSADFKEGWLIGMICGDGHLGKPTSAKSEHNHVSLSVNYQQTYLGDTFNEYLRFFGLPELVKRDGNRCWNFTRNDKKLYEFFTSRIIGIDTYTKHIDTENKSIEFLLGFLDGYLCADGRVAKTYISVSSVNEMLIKNVESILDILNLYHNQHTCFENHKRPNTKPLYTVHLSPRLLKYTLNCNKKMTETNLKVDSTREIYYYGKLAFKNAKSNTKTIAMISTASNQQEFYKTDVIESIEVIPNDNQYVYEIETSSHYYNDGGFVTHNCATVEFLMCFDYFARKDFGDNYLETHKDFILDKFQQVVYSLNQPAGARSYQCPFWNISIFDKYYFEGLFSEFMFPDDEGTAPCWETLEKLQKCFMEWFNKEREVSLLTFPVVTAASLTENGKCKDEDFNDFLCDQMSKGNSFFNYMSDDVDSLSSCCRLRNALTDNTFSFSLGAGGVMAGSMNVITINFNRLVQNAKRAGIEISDAIATQMDKLYKYQSATNTYYKDLLSMRMLPAYDAHFIEMKKQYMTIGVNGLLEAAEFLGYTPGNNQEYQTFLQTVLKQTSELNKQARKTYGIMYNVEFVPAENLGVKNYKWDKQDGYQVNPKRNCYNSYFYPSEASDDECNIVDKFVLHGRETIQYLDGGSALHLNLAEYPTKEGYKKLFELAAKTGCNYWTTNVAVTCCEDCGYIGKRTQHHCHKCKSRNVTWATRIIGYLRKITSFSEARQIEEGMRYYHKINPNEVSSSK